MLRFSDFVTCRKNIIIRAGGLYLSFDCMDTRTWDHLCYAVRPWDDNLEHGYI